MTDPELDPILALHRAVDRVDSLEDDLNRIAHLACDVVGAASHVGITLLKDGKGTTAAATDAATLRLDEAQYVEDDGPCLSAYKEGRPIEIVSMAQGERWPTFRSAALAHGVQGSLSMPLTVDGKALGALNMYALEIGPFSDTDRAKAVAFAAQASIALSNSQSFLEVSALTEQLRDALESRDVIGQAKGILMARHTITADEAFERLSTASQHQNRKLRSIAEDVARTGEIVDG